MGNGQLDIYKASAGSGKTHTLTHKYISYLLADPTGKEAYKHILAVTFTNKATEEMKSRIVNTLHELSRGKGDELKDKGPQEAAEIQSRAKKALTAILHDYSNFQVCTIDKFFQQIFRSFARELGSFSNYRVELRDDEVLSRVVDEMLSNLDEDSADSDRVFDTLNRFALEQLRYFSKNSYQDRLLEFAELFLKEDFKSKVAGNEDDYTADSNKIDRIADSARKAAKEFEEQLREMAQNALAIADEQGLTVEDFAYGASGGMGKVARYAEGVVEQPSDRLRDMASKGIEAWFSKAKFNVFQARAQAADSNGLGAQLTAIVDHFKDYAQYRTALIVRTNVGVMKIFGNIYSTLLKYLKDNNIMLLGETTQALNKMIAGSDAPFIYERVGSWIDHYLLDEFQDFSLMQWTNFKPLLEESLGNNHDNLIVGDVKQSIYRWRGSDWNTLDNGVETELAGKTIHTKHLDVNWRSDCAIVDFNNYVFRQLTAAENGRFGGDKTIDNAFSDCEQQKESKKEGHVKVSWYEKPEDGSNPALAALKGEIEALDALGYSRSDIYVLVRTNAQAAQAAEQLISDGIEVITEESLVVGISSYVQRIVAVLRYMVNPEDSVNNQVLKELGIEAGAVDNDGNSLYDVCESIVRSLPKELCEGQMPYLMTFMDLVLDYMRDYGSDMAGFLRWWDDVGSSSALSAPRGADAVRIMTIHKAKGLGCPVAIVPFFHEALSPSKSFTNYMWCEDISPLKAGLLPVEFKSSVKDSTFKPDFEREELYYKMDALNTAYVAFTRAKHELIVFAQMDNHIEGVSDKMYKLLEKDDKLEDNVYEAGSREPYKAPEEDPDSVKPMALTGYNSIPLEGTGQGRKRLALVLRGSDFFDPDGRDAARERGIVLHDILSRINTADDIVPAVDAAVAAGELPEAERAATENRVRTMLAAVASYGWFGKGVEALNELSIIDTDGKVWRPDRVVIRGDSVAVVDYKFGTSHSGYRAQVRRYMDMLRRMGYENVEGYLWYAAEDKIEKVA